MKSTRALAALTVSLVSLSPVFVPPAIAGSATQVTADRMEAALQAYFGKVPGTLSVMPEGDAYHLHIDLASVLAKLPTDVKVTISPLDYMLTDQGDGLWGTHIVNHPLSVSVEANGKAGGNFNQKLTIEKISSTGTFDENLHTFTSAVVDISGFAMHQRVGSVSGDRISAASFRINSMHAESSTKPGTAGVDTAMHLTATGIIEGLTGSANPDPAGALHPGMPLTIAAKSMTLTVNVTGERVDGILGHYRWVIAHPSQAEIAAAKGELPGLVRMALPIFDKLDGSETVDGVTVAAPFGTIGIDNVSYTVAMNGVVQDGMLSGSMGFKGLHLPDGIAPPWVTALLPKDATLHVRLSDFDSAAPVKLLLDAAEADQSIDSPAFMQKLRDAAMPKGTITISTDGTGLTGSGYGVNVTGKVEPGPDIKAPPMDFTVIAQGYDAVLNAINGAPANVKQKVVPMLMLARGFGKQAANGDVTWKIKTSPKGNLLINGHDMGLMGRK